MKNTFCYIHIPFCTSKCKYCRFASFGNTNKLKINLYIKKLLREIKETSYTITDYKNKHFLKSVYFGGGTPSVLNIFQLSNIINTLKTKYIFDDNIEINLEATPITITKENLIGWQKIGINRLSIGVQTLNNNTLLEIGRGEKGDIFKALDEIEKNTSHLVPLLTGEGDNLIRNISIDFIIGLPYVKKGEIKKDIEFILNKYDFIKHISVYMLEEYYDEGMIQSKSDETNSKFEKIIYPSNWKKIGIKEDYYLGEYIEIKEFLKTKGFESYEISNFSKKGYECKHNKAYWNHSNIISFGLGAHSFINNVRFSNSEEFLGYYSGTKNDIEVLSETDLFIEKLMFGLRTNGLKQELYEKLDKKKIDYFLENGLLFKKNNLLRITNSGILLLDYILSEII